MFGKLSAERQCSVNSVLKNRVNYRRQKTDIYSVELLNKFKKSIYTNSQNNPMSRPMSGKSDRKSKSRRKNVGDEGEACECPSAQRDKRKPDKAEFCVCTEKYKGSEGLLPINMSQDDGIHEGEIGKKAFTEVEAARGKKGSTGVSPKRYQSGRYLTYNVKQASTLSFNPVKIYIFGERGSGFKTKGPEQDFYELREAHLNSGTLFEDPEFPANSRSLSFDGRADRRIVWKRPREIHADPQLFIEGFSRFDVQQGELGDCWLLAAVANITLYKRLFFQIVPEDQGFDEDYAGIFHFRFWQYGRWVDVVIDDRLPTIHDELVYLHSSEKNEFWSALLEKAYAKIHGCYEALKGGSTCEAMEDFTGGVTEMYEMEAAPPNLFKIMQKAYERCSLMGCSIEPDPNVFEAQTPEGLIRGHAYSITKICFVDIATPNVSGKIPLIRMRNPWGNEVEWNGPWSDGAPEWRYITPENQQALGLNFDNDGEFWISYKDFQTHFSRLEICNLNPDSLTGEEFSNKKKWIMSVFEGRWVKGVTAGGCRNFLETFWHNPQYRVTLTQVDEEEQDNKCTLIIALMQKNRRKLGGGELLTMGFAIYHLPYPDRVPKPLDLNFFKYNASVARSPSFINLREVSCRFRLPPGSYCIVPSTYDPGEEAEFLLRVFTENESHSEENDAEVGAIKRAKTTKVHAEQIQKNEEVAKLFQDVAGDGKEINWEQLKLVLDTSMKAELRGHTFSDDTCRSMVAMLDDDQSGKLSYDEFKYLWDAINMWREVFSDYDKDASGALSGFELREALNHAGYSVNTTILNIIMNRYGNSKDELTFQDFILVSIKLKTMLDTFDELMDPLTNMLTISKDAWIVRSMYT